MTDASPAVLREFETWLSLFTDGELPERHRWKAWFCVAEYELADFERVSALLRENGATGSFAFLGRDAEEQAEIIETLDADGHEITFHSHRHHAYADLSYDTAHDAITTGMAAIEDARRVSRQAGSSSRSGDSAMVQFGPSRTSGSTGYSDERIGISRTSNSWNR